MYVLYFVEVLYVCGFFVWLGDLFGFSGGYVKEGLFRVGFGSYFGYCVFVLYFVVRGRLGGYVWLEGCFVGWWEVKNWYGLYVLL